MGGNQGFFNSDEQLKALSVAGDPLERLAQVIDFELFRSDLHRRSTNRYRVLCNCKITYQISETQGRKSCQT
jgi:hypothetical protein